MRIEVETITPEKAEEFLKLNLKNRKINSRRVSSYADQMRRGLWKLTHQGISIGPKHVIDGQHRLKAIVAANISVEMMVCYEDSEENFKHVDTGKVRNAGDIFEIEDIKNAKTIAAGVRTYIKLTKNHAGQHASAYVMKLTSHDILEEYRSDSDFYQEAYKHALNCYEKVHLYPIPDLIAFISYLYKVKNYDKDDIINFFSELFALIPTVNVNLESLRDALIKDAFSATKMTHKLKNDLLKRAWNNYANGIRTDKLVLRVKRGEKIEFE